MNIVIKTAKNNFNNIGTKKGHFYAMFLESVYATISLYKNVFSYYELGGYQDVNTSFYLF